MLPGIRFVLATMLLTVSLAICGLGATALLRAAQQDSADLPALQAMRDPFPPSLSTTPPTFAVMRVELPVPATPTGEADQSDKNDAVVASIMDSAVSAAPTTSLTGRPAGDAATQSAPTETEPPAIVAKTPDTSPLAISTDAMPTTPPEKIGASDPPFQQAQTTSSTDVPDGQSTSTASSTTTLAASDAVTGSIDPATKITAQTTTPAKAKKRRVVRRLRGRRIARNVAPRQQPAAKQASTFGL